MSYRPLTLTLSRGEREQPLFHFKNSGGCRAEGSHLLTKRRGAIFPLRWGEGQGEGKVHTTIQVIANHLIYPENYEFS